MRRADLLASCPSQLLVNGTDKWIDDTNVMVQWYSHSSCNHQCRLMVQWYSHSNCYHQCHGTVVQSQQLQSPISWYSGKVTAIAITNVIVQWYSHSNCNHQSHGTVVQSQQLHAFLVTSCCVPRNCVHSRFHGLSHASVSLMTNCACAIMVIIAKEGACYKGMWEGDKKLKLWNLLSDINIA